MSRLDLDLAVVLEAGDDRPVARDRRVVRLKRVEPDAGAVPHLALSKSSPAGAACLYTPPSLPTRSFTPPLAVRHEDRRVLVGVGRGVVRRRRLGSVALETRGERDTPGTPFL